MIYTCLFSMKNGKLESKNGRSSRYQERKLPAGSKVSMGSLLDTVIYVKICQKKCQVGIYLHERRILETVWERSEGSTLQ